ncbi:putative inactive cadmium/zinc-transporting ATPase HMA3 [Arachis stenosperma]|uniref:putative inactive cadmium/zinc-transporting ATPase HMA3 n=1 Tax=Arachis stenosperma TaxID=217475 RepID=UPI0025AD7B28|nr:putative inactive cadmium/zinc-transporting ATPase HMA3 [Arachis stenosperma]XP_057748635.1 putative inactive cadmium/zinc-transporting ATPase HMA3 [Arachis stenosperma]
MENEEGKKKWEKSYFDVMGLCCSSEVPLIENILKPLQGVKEVSVIVPTRTVIVIHDSLIISQLQIVKALNQARLEANVRVYGDQKHQKQWPSLYSIVCGLLLLLSLLKFVYHPLQYLALGAVAAGIFPIARKAIVSIQNLRLDINILMITAVIGTIAMNDYLEAGTIVFLFSIAEWLESRASHKANAVMSSLMNIAPQKAVIAETGEVVDADEVKVNTILAVKAGEVIPIDGVVVDGTCEVDEKTLTGESFPVAKQKDSTVWAGTINLNGYVSVKTTALAEDCVVAKMAKLVEEAQNSKTSTQRLIDKFAKFYTPAVVIISALVAVIPIVLKVHDKKHWLHFALVVLVSACPCALILSTPVATFCAYTKAATSGLLIKGGDYLETLAKIKVMAFDKTGTITKGEFVVTNFVSLSDDIDLNTLLYWVSSIESKSSHPLAAAIVDYGRSLSIEPNPENVTEFENFPGEGIYGKIEERPVYVGNKKIATRAGSETVPAMRGQIGKTTGYIYCGATPVGFFSLSDACRTGVPEAIAQLKSLGIKTAMLTGDSQGAAMQAQEQLGNALELVHAELLPEDKLKIITEFKKEGPTAMVGDGLNDAPALATADIGISMGISGSALATETGNIILMSNDLRKIPEVIKLAKKSHRKVIQNIFLSVITKAAIIGLAIGGHPLVWAAVLADVGTCLVVILNSMLLLRGEHNHGEHNHGEHKHGNHDHDGTHKHGGHKHGEHKHGGKCCRPSPEVHVQKDVCGGTDGDSSHHHDHHHGKSSHHHHHHNHHHHEQLHQHKHHSHKHCGSEETKQVSLPQKCASETCSSKNEPCPSDSRLDGSVKHHNVMGSHEHCKGHQKHDHIEDHCRSETHNVIPNAENNGALHSSHCHGTEHCHKETDIATHEQESSHSSHNHMIHGCENPKGHNPDRNSGSHSEIEKAGTSEITIDIDDDVESASKHGCCMEEEENDLCCDGCSDKCKELPVACDCESSNEAQVISSCCSSNEGSTKECRDSTIVHACISLNKRGYGGCCKSYMKECCAEKHRHSGAGFGGGLSEIITEYV